MSFRGVIVTTPSYAQWHKLKDLVARHTGGLGGGAPQPPEATVVSISSLRRSGSAWELRAYRLLAASS